MSRSITELFASLRLAAKNPVQPEGQLFNPDIPDMKSAGMKEREKTRDNFYSAMKLSSDVMVDLFILDPVNCPLPGMTSKDMYITPV